MSPVQASGSRTAHTQTHTLSHTHTRSLTLILSLSHTRSLTLILSLSHTQVPGSRPSSGGKAKDSIRGYWLRHTTAESDGPDDESKYRPGDNPWGKSMVSLQASKYRSNYSHSIRGYWLRHTSDHPDDESK